MRFSRSERAWLKWLAQDPDNRHLHWGFMEGLANTRIWGVDEKHHTIRWGRKRYPKWLSPGNASWVVKQLQAQANSQVTVSTCLPNDREDWFQGKGV